MMKLFRCKRRNEEADVEELESLRGDSIKASNETLNNMLVKVKGKPLWCFEGEKYHLGKEIRCIEHYNNECRFGLFEHMSNAANKWNAKCKGAIIFIGGSRDLSVNQKITNSIYFGLFDIAKETPMWVITSGTDEDVSKLISEIIPHNSADSNLTFIGLTPIKYVAINDTAMDVKRFHSARRNKRNRINLNNRYSSFIFLGNYENDDKIKTLVEQYQKYVKEIFIKTSSVDSFVLDRVFIVIEGGIETLGVVREATKSGKFVILFKHTNGCADLLIDCLNIAETNKSEEWLAAFQKIFRKIQYEEFSLTIDKKNETTSKIFDIMRYKTRLKVFNFEEKDEKFSIILKECFAAISSDQNLKFIKTESDNSYIRIAHVSTSNLKLLYQNLLLSLGLSKPKYLINVHYGNDESIFNLKFKKDFKKSLLKHKDAWIITDMTNELLEVYSEMAQEDPELNGLTIIGFTSNVKVAESNNCRKIITLLHEDEISNTTSSFNMHLPFRNKLTSFLQTTCKITNISIVIGEPSQDDFATLIEDTIKHSSFLIPIYSEKSEYLNKLFIEREKLWDVDHEIVTLKHRYLYNNNKLKEIKSSIKENTKNEFTQIDTLLKLVEYDSRNIFLEPLEYRKDDNEKTLDATLSNVLSKTFIPTDTLNESYCKTIKYIKCFNRSDEPFIANINENLVYAFRTKEPKLIISIVDSLDYSLNYTSLKNELLTKVLDYAKSKITWIISSGVASDELSRMIVEKVQGNKSIELLGIAPEAACSSMFRANNSQCESYFTNLFILNGIKERFDELEFRFELEQHIKKDTKVLRILIVLGTGNEALIAIKNALDNKDPVLHFCTKSRSLLASCEIDEKSEARQLLNKISTFAKTSDHVDKFLKHSENQKLRETLREIENVTDFQTTVLDWFEEILNKKGSDNKELLEDSLQVVDYLLENMRNENKEFRDELINARSSIFNEIDCSYRAELIEEIKFSKYFDYLYDTIDYPDTDRLDDVISKILMKDVTRPFYECRLGSDIKALRFKYNDPNYQPCKLYDHVKKGLDIPVPSMMLSLFGTKNYFPIDQDLKDAVGEAIISVAKRVDDALITTTGLNDSISNIISDAIGENPESTNIILLGVTSNRALEDVNSLNRRFKKFIFLESDDPKLEIRFRTDLASDINATQESPRCIILFGGSLENAFDFLHQNSSSSNKRGYNKSYALVANTGGMADLAIRAIKDGADSKEFLNFLEEKAKGSMISKEKLNILIDSVKTFIENNKGRIIIIEEPNKEIIETKLLETIINNEEDIKVKIKYAMLWDLNDIAKAYLPALTYTSDSYYVGKIFKEALIKNKPFFVDMVLKNGYSTELLYNEECCELTHTDFFIQIYNSTAENKKIEEFFPLYVDKDDIDYEDIRSFFITQFDTFNPVFFPENSKFKSKLHCDLYLFFWCILTNRLEMAKIFWKIGCNQICFALMAVKILKYFAPLIPDERDTIEAYANEFEDLAIGVLDVFYDHTSESVKDVLIIRHLDFIQMDCLQLALDCKCKRFLSHPIIQKTLDEIWRGSLERTVPRITWEKKLKECQKKYNSNESYVFNQNKMNKIAKTRSKNLFTKFTAYLHVPKWKFLVHVILYVVFLLIFTETMLIEDEFEPDDEIKTAININETIDLNNTTTTDSTGPINLLKRIKFPIREFFLFFWIMSIFLEEIRQAFFSNLTKGTFKMKLLKHMKDGWNIFDFFGCGFFIIGFAVKIVYLNTPFSYSTYIASRILLSVDLCIWYIRSLQFCTLYESLGPKLVMIKKMVNDLKYFLIIIGTFLFAFGVALQSIVQPYSEFSSQVIFDILEKVYWPIHGELKVLDDLRERRCGGGNDTDRTQCLDIPRFALINGLLMLYMIISSVLLLNLLIAMFTTTFESIQSKSGVVWMNQRYELVSQYLETPRLPSPFNVKLITLTIGHIYSKLKHCGRTKYDIGSFYKEKNMDDEDTYGLTNDAIVEYERTCACALLKLRKAIIKSDANERLNSIDKKLSNQDDVNKIFQKQLDEINKGFKNLSAKFPEIVNRGTEEPVKEKKETEIQL